MRRLLIAVALLVAAAAPGAQTETSGDIVGQVILTTRVHGSGLPSTTYQPRAVNTHLAAAIPEIKNVVVALKDVVFRGVLPTTRQSIRQEHEEFAPRVLAVTRGSTVDFPNADPIFHNVFSLGSAASFDLGRYPMGQSKSATFAKPGLVKVYCHLHSQMSASIRVLDHPYFTIPDADGAFRIPNVPAGSYTIAGWHERVGERGRPVTVIGGQTAAVFLSLPIEDLK